MAAKQRTKRARNGQLSQSDVRHISLDLIDPPADNPREHFDPSEIDSLAESIADVGLLQPVIIRQRGGRFELVAGERRYRAMKQLGWSTVPATVRQLSDREAAEIRLLENIDRKSLNAVEEGRALEILQALGHDLDSLTKLVRWNEGDVANRLQLLELPEPWQQLLREDGISLAAVEYVLPFRSQAGVLDAMLKHARCRWPLPLVEWRRLLNDAVMTLSRSLEPDEPTGPRFELTEDRLERLAPVDLELSPRQTVKRAFAVDLWDEWQDAADAAPLETASGDEVEAIAGNGNGQSTRARAAGNGRNGSNGSHAHAPHRNPVRERELSAAVRDFKADWLRSLITARLAKLDVDALEDVAASLSIDAAAAWELRRPFLSIFQEPELRDLAGELEVDVSQCVDAGECVAVLLHAQPTRIPQLLADC